MLVVLVFGPAHNKGTSSHCDCKQHRNRKGNYYNCFKVQFFSADIAVTLAIHSINFNYFFLWIDCKKLITRFDLLRTHLTLFSHNWQPGVRDLLTNTKLMCPLWIQTHTHTHKQRHRDWLLSNRWLSLYASIITLCWAVCGTRVLTKQLFSRNNGTLCPSTLAWA